MPKKSTSIPVRQLSDEHGSGIALEKLTLKDVKSSAKELLNNGEEAWKPHRHDRHSFFFLEKGTISIEIDFQKYKVKSPSILYMHPSQVHRILSFEKISVISLAIDNDHLHPDYLKKLEEIMPAKPLVLKKEVHLILGQMVTLCIKFYENKNKLLYHSILKDSCNALVGFIISQYVERTKAVGKFSRFSIVSKAFSQLLEVHYLHLKRPAEYAETLNISTPYLNECVKNSTGYSVSHHIQQRIILEAKRLLYHSNKSVKEIAFELGYDNYPYFSRLFTHVAGMTPLTFRQKNHD